MLFKWILVELRIVNKFTDKEENIEEYFEEGTEPDKHLIEWFERHFPIKRILSIAWFSCNSERYNASKE